jgi:hypothetical protein
MVVAATTAPLFICRLLAINVAGPHAVQTAPDVMLPTAMETPVAPTPPLPETVV